MNLEILSIVAPAFIMGLVIVLTHAPLGVEVLKRGIIFIDLAVAQISGFGYLFAKLYLHDASVLFMQFVALLFAMSAGLFFRFIEKKIPVYQEAIIGISFVVAASLSILFLADHPHGGDEITHLLSGQMLFISWFDIFRHLPIYIFILIVWFLLPKIRQGSGFYIIFALAITSSVQLVGVYVVFASLILPAFASIKSKSPLRVAWPCGLLSIVSGIYISILFDFPAGPIMVISYVFWAVILLFIRFKLSHEKDFFEEMNSK